MLCRFPFALIPKGESHQSHHEIFLANFIGVHNVKEYEVYSPASHEIIDNVFFKFKRKIREKIEVNSSGMKLEHRAADIFA